MIKNAQSLKSKVRNYAKLTGLNHQQILQNYMFERFLNRVSVSEYKNNFILKGGCLLSSIMGIEMRSTMDIDSNITGIPFHKDTIEIVIQNIIQIDLDDNTYFEMYDIKEIKESKEYNGYRFSLIGHLENLRIPFHLDISTGDIITPQSILYQYKMLLEDEFIELLTYNNETIIAEKLQPILDLKIKNSRMKDYYDIYYFFTFKWHEIDKTNLRDAICKTFENRNTISDWKNATTIIDVLFEDETLQKLWNNYSKTHNYAKHIDFSDIAEALHQICSI